MWVPKNFHMFDMIEPLFFLFTIQKFPLCFFTVAKVTMCPLSVCVTCSKMRTYQSVCNKLSVCVPYYKQSAHNTNMPC